MREETAPLAASVRSAASLESQVALIGDRYRGTTCVIATCGPSLAAVPAAQLRSGLQGVLTIAVKQAIEVVGDQADFHCWNSFNVSRFSRPSPSTIRCFVASPTGRIAQWNRRDVEFPQVDGHGSLATSLAFNRDFANHLIADDPLRPFGPGIMYELAFYLAVHLGVSRIITIGWDIADPAGKNTHFYDNRNDRSYFERGRAEVPAATQPISRPRLTEPLRYPLHRAKTALAHVRGQLYNPTQSLIGESKLVGESTAELAGWLREAGVEIVALTDSAAVGTHIRRIGVEEFFDDIRTG